MAITASKLVVGQTYTLAGPNHHPAFTAVCAGTAPFAPAIGQFNIG